jgi:hypothetical protein
MLNNLPSIRIAQPMANFSCFSKVTYVYNSGLQLYAFLHFK